MSTIVHQAQPKIIVICKNTGKHIRKPSKHVTISNVDNHKETGFVYNIFDWLTYTYLMLQLKCLLG